MVFKGIWTPVFSFLKKKYDFNEKKAMEKARFEPAIFQSQVKRYTNWAIEPSYRLQQHFIILINTSSNQAYEK